MEIQKPFYNKNRWKNEMFTTNKLNHVPLAIWKKYLNSD